MLSDSFDQRPLGDCDFSPVRLLSPGVSVDPQGVVLASVFSGNLVVPWPPRPWTASMSSEEGPPLMLLDSFEQSPSGDCDLSAVSLLNHAVTASRQRAVFVSMSSGRHPAKNAALADLPVDPISAALVQRIHAG